MAASAKPFIEAEEVFFTGGTAYTEKYTLHVPHPDPVRYTGDPSPEIDRNWEELTLKGTCAQPDGEPARRANSLGPWVLLTEREAKEAFEEDFGDIQAFWSPIRGGYSSG